MSARDIYHDHVKNALVKDGWKITHDPLWLKWNRKDAYIDLGAERIIIAEKAKRKIAVEVKSFVSASEMRDLCEAIGQFVLYRRALSKNDPKHELFLAVREEVCVPSVARCAFKEKNNEPSVSCDRLYIGQVRTLPQAH